MPDFLPVNAKSYYEFLPSAKDECGDIWNNIPEFGLFETEAVTAILVSPACDISNFKTETLTFLPIISISRYFSTLGFLPTLRREIEERLKSAELELSLDWFDPGYRRPISANVEKEILRLQVEKTQATKNKGRAGHIERAISGLNIVISGGSASPAMYSDVSSLFGSKWDALKRQIITNSYRPDLHFFPRDGQPVEIPGIKEHSVAMLRYPITIPTEFLSASQHMAASQWREFLGSSLNSGGFGKHFCAEMPIKSLSLKAQFLSDLISRFTSLYGRIGSPDFSRATVEKISNEFTDG